jgi:asparagine synthase (glutamine-hydrolysing)
MEAEVTPSLEESLGQVIANLGEPFAIASAIPAYYVFKALHEKATVALTGDGGDEIFAGYEYYAIEPFIRGLTGAENIWRRVYGTSNALYAVMPTLRRVLKPTMAALQLLSQLPPTEASWEARRILTPACYSQFESSARWTAYWGGRAPVYEGREPLRSRMLWDQRDSLPNHMLTKVDITSMANGVEARSPLLDWDVVEFARSLPMGYLRNGHRGKRILRDLLKGDLPKQVLSKSKTGFALPLRDLFSTGEKACIQDRLLSRNNLFGQLVQRERIPDLLRSHDKGQPPQTMLILKLLVLKMWLDKECPYL